MSELLRFLQFNLLASLLAGLAVWALVVLGLRIFRIGYGRLRLSLLYAPVVKSLLVLVGLAAVFPGVALFSTWKSQALGPGDTLPWLLILIGISLVGQRAYKSWIQRRTLKDAHADGAAMSRLRASAERAHTHLRDCPVEVAGDVACCVRNLPDPRLLLHDRIESPLAIEAEPRPVIIFPTDLVSEMSDDDLDYAMAHELAHLMVRNPAWCGPEVIRHLGSIVPVSQLLRATLKFEEEKACDDMAVAALGDPEEFAAMLVKSYRFARAKRGPVEERLRALPRLVGAKPGLQKRVERLTAEHDPTTNLRFQAVRACLMWTGLIVLLF